jgi:multimeric flavodoxin WrbA
LKILVLLGSARKGNTYKLFKLVQEKMQSYGAVEFEEIFLNDLKLDFCCSCHSCFLNGEKTCPHNDIIAKLEEKLLQADAFIMTSPIYSLHLSAVVKNVLDHLAYVFHRPRFYDKKALIITSTVGAAEKDVIKFLKTVFKFWGVNRTYGLGVKLFALEIKITKSLGKKVEQVSRKFYDDIQSQRLHTPSLKDLFKFNMWKVVNSLGEKEATFDYQYWKNKGWLEADYFAKVPLNPFKKSFGRLIYRMLKLLMSGLTKKTT